MNEYVKERIIKELCKKFDMDYENEYSGTLELMLDCYLLGYQDGIKDRVMYIGAPI